MKFFQGVFFVLLTAVAIGPAAQIQAAFDYEPFNYTGTTLNGQNGGTGWSGGWIATGASLSDVLSNDNVSLSYPNTWQSPLVPPTPTGSRVQTGGLSANASSSRLLSQTIDLSVGGTTKYVSALIRKNRPNGETANDNVLIEFVDASANRRWGLGIEGATDRPWLNANGSGTAATNVTVGDTYFLVAKIVAGAGGSQVSGGVADSAFLKVYGTGYSNQVTVAEPSIWDVTLTQFTAAVLDRIRVRIDSANTANLPGEVDEIRIGDTWSSVTAVAAVPEPLACLVFVGTIVVGGFAMRRKLV